MSGPAREHPREGTAAAGTRSRGRPGYDQATVLRRAIELFNRQGYDGTSMGDLARELGVSKSAIYHHVPSKEHLLEQALDEALRELSAVVDAAVGSEPGTAGIASGRSAHHRLRTVIHRSVEVLVAHLPAVTLLLRVRGNSPLELAALQRRREIDLRLAGLVRAAIDEGALRDDLAPELVSRLLFGMVNSVVEWFRPEGPVSGPALADAITTMVFEGLDAER